jgi:hypothetical protein
MRRLAAASIPVLKPHMRSSALFSLGHVHARALVQDS